MKLFYRLAVLILLFLPSLIVAEPFQTIGRGRLFTNDYLTDGQDRWRSGSYVFSLVKSRSSWAGRLPDRFGELVELRFRNEILAPSNLINPAAGDRKYAGVLSFGLHSHSRLAGGAELSAGVDLVGAGPGTGVGRFHDVFHNYFSGRDPDIVFDDQITGLFPTATLELARPVKLSDSATARPFIEGIAGVETLVRVGADVVLGQVGQNDLFLRDVTTGQLYRGAQLPTGGLSLVFGGDVAYVSDSKYLPAADGYVLTDSRTRIRAGIHWLSGEKSAFYGITWLGREFVGQREGQFTGSLRLMWQF
jgi:hypothetical protein